jgi:uncharacterized protein YjeT (DUF2065 family)
VVLLGVAGLIAVQVPTTLVAVEPAWVRVVCQLGSLVVVVGLAIFVRPRAVRRAAKDVASRVVNSLRPPKGEADTLRDTPVARRDRDG